MRCDPLLTISADTSAEFVHCTVVSGTRIRCFSQKSHRYSVGADNDKCWRELLFPHRSASRPSQFLDYYPLEPRLQKSSKCVPFTFRTPLLEGASVSKRPGGPLTTSEYTTYLPQYLYLHITIGHSAQCTNDIVSSLGCVHHRVNNYRLTRSDI